MFMIFSRYVITFTSSCHSNMYMYIYIFLTEFLITCVGHFKFIVASKQAMEMDKTRILLVTMIQEVKDDYKG